MAAIKKLDDKLIGKIAAGEVVENPASVVKELLENSIDAGADSITVEIEQAGRKLIRISDNGRGIPKDQLPLAFERHATSKLSEEKDLFEIRSLGFRGEALASISAVSELEIITRTADSQVGAKAAVKNGGLLETADVGTSTGTTVICRNLFSKIPARLKFLKSDTVETNRILDIVNRLAASQRHISFRFISNSRHLYTTPGNDDLGDTLYSIYGKKLAGDLVEIECYHKGISLHGMVSTLKNHHSNKKMQVFYVNKRWVKSDLMSEMLNNAYSHLLDKRRYPVAFLFLDMHPSTVDINISPNKTEIKFNDESSVSSLFKDAFSGLVSNRSWIPSETISAEKTIMHDMENGYVPVRNGSGSPFRQSPPKEYVRQDEVMYKPDAEIQIESFLEEMAKQDVKTITKTQYTENLPKRNPDYFKKLRIVGQLFNSYIVCEEPSTAEMVIIDQHAAHEKVLYEDYTSQIQDNSLVSQMLLEPIPLDMPDTEKSVLLESMGHLQTWGFDLEDFGPNALLIRQIPSMFSISVSIAFLNEMKDMLLDSASAELLNSEELQYSLAVKACHTAVRANDRLGTVEIKALLEYLDRLDNPYTCPHGRPTVVKICKTEIEKYFNR